MERLRLAAIERLMRRAERDPNLLLEDPLLKARPKVVKQEKVPNLAKRPYLSLTEETRMRIIYLRWGSLTEFGQVQMTTNIKNEYW